MSQCRCDLVAQYFCRHVVEIEDAVIKIKRYYDTIRERELEVSKSYELKIVFEEDAIDFLIEQLVHHKATGEEILTKLYDDYYDGFNLIREKTGAIVFSCRKAV